MITIYCLYGTLGVYTRIYYKISKNSRYNFFHFSLYILIVVKIQLTGLYRYNSIVIH